MPAAWAVFVDFDGTITDRDTFDVLVPRFASKEAWDDMERALENGTATIREVLAAQAALVRGERAVVYDMLSREIHVDPTFGAFARRCIAAKVPLTIVSSGVTSLIRDRLAALDLAQIPIVANEVDASPEGWVMHFRDPVGNGTDKAKIVATAQANGRRTLFVGDGRSDYDAAERADVCFAKRGLPLERYLRERAIPFVAFDTFDDVERRCASLDVFMEDAENG